MAPFMFRADSRFSPGTYGVLYAAESFDIAVRESVYHTARTFIKAKMSAARIPRLEFRMRLQTRRMADIRPGKRDDAKDPDVYDPDPTRYAAAQRVGKDLREKGKWSVRYTSVRKPPGSCFAVLVPKAIAFVEQEAQNLVFVWNGTRVAETEIVSTMYL